jgi:hypothetical protein
MKSPSSLTVLVAVSVAACPAFAQEVALTPAEQKAADMRLPELDRSALQPEKREPETVREGERNPFGLIVLPKEEEEVVETVQTETEEMRIRRILVNMRISGLSGSEGSYRAILGPMSIKEGDTLPKLFANQAEVLRVAKITDREVVLSFAEKDTNLPPRTLALGFDLQPRPNALLAGEFFKKLVPFTAKGVPDLKPVEMPSVKAVIEGAEASNLEGLVERSSELMGDPSYRSGYEAPSAKED